MTKEAKKETADALSQADLRKQSLTAQQAQSEAAHAAFVESRNRYFSGISDYTTVLTALNTYQSAELNLITAQRDYVAALVNLQYLAAEQVAR